LDTYSAEAGKVKGFLEREMQNYLGPNVGEFY